jgi:hypothetical protein
VCGALLLLHANESLLLLLLLLFFNSLAIPALELRRVALPRPHLLDAPPREAGHVVATLAAEINRLECLF